jgi:hypothetical protein
MAAGLALKGLYLGADRIPDKVFENAPYVGPRYYRPKDRDQNQQNQDSSDDESRRSRRRSKREKRRAEREQTNRGYDSDQGPVATYAPPVDDGAPRNRDPPKAFIPRPYNPAEYGARRGSRDAYFAGHPLEQQPTPYPAQTAVPQQSVRHVCDRFDVELTPRQDQETTRHSTAADRYMPPNYGAYKHETHARNPSPGGGGRNSSYGGSRQPQTLVVRHPQPGTLYPEYQPPEWGDGGARRSGSRHRGDSSHGRSKSRSRSRAGSRVREALHDHKDVASTSFGVLAGSIIGNQVTSRKGHSSAMGLVGGAILGGVVGHVLEQGYEKREKKKERRRRYSDSYDDY